MHRLYAKTTSLYMKDLNLYGFWYPQEVLDPILQGYQGSTKYFGGFVQGFLTHSFYTPYNLLSNYNSKNIFLAF